MPARNILIGIGNVLHGDDGLGPFLAREFSDPAWQCFDAGTTPENFTSVIRRENPERVVLVDAARIGNKPGEFRRISKEKVRDVGVGTHQLSLTLLMDYLEQFVPQVIFIGIEPDTLNEDTPLSPNVKTAAQALMVLLQKNEMEKIPWL
jgi:hydrogenase 3 maturation protease